MVGVLRDDQVIRTNRLVPLLQLLGKLPQHQCIGRAVRARHGETFAKGNGRQGQGRQHGAQQ